MFGLFVFIMAGTILWMALLFILPHSDFVTQFNANQGNGAYLSVLATANKAGFQILPTAVFLNTFSAIIYAFQSYNGFQNSGYFSGEIKQAPSSAMRAMIAALIFGAIGFSLGMLAIYHYYGQDFIGALATNGLVFPNSTALPFPAVMPSLGLFVTDNPIIHLIIALTFLAAIFWIQPPAVLIGTRNLFAWSFDRLLPGRIADVNDRLHSPVVATVIVAIVIELFTWITIKTSYFGNLLGLAGFQRIGRGHRVICSRHFPLPKTRNLRESSCNSSSKIPGVTCDYNLGRTLDDCERGIVLYCFHFTGLWRQPECVRSYILKGRPVKCTGYYYPCTALLCVAGHNQEYSTP